MKIQTKLSIIIVSSFLFLLIPLSISYSYINKNNRMLSYLSQKQIQLNYFTYKLNYDIKRHQTNVLQLILLKKIEKLQNTDSSFKKIHQDVAKIELFISQHKEQTPLAFLKLFNIIKKRVIAYKLVQQSLYTAIHVEDELDIHDALIGFNSIAAKFSTDTQKLLELSNSELYSKIKSIQENNASGHKTLTLSFLIALFLVSLSLYRFNKLHKNLKEQLIKTQKTEVLLQNAKTQLLKYNDDLEKEINKITKELREKIYNSFLTGLPNRNQLLEDMKTQKFSKIAILDIDKFQSFNDIYGEEFGNIAISLSAKFLILKIVDKELKLYHLSGDEFCLVCTNGNIGKPEEFILTVESILKEFSAENFQYEEKSFQLVMSAGISFSGKDKMLAYADMALKDAKNRNVQVSIFNEDKQLEKTHKEDLECHQKLVSALKSDSIISYFQPIVPIQDTKLATKYESLVRLKDEAGNIIPPFKFLNVAKRNRIYYKISHTVMKNTFLVVQKYQIPSSINISLDDIENEATMKYFFALLENFSYSGLLTVELLETEDFNNYNLVYDFCVKVRSFGVKVALDDFGSGYANFSHILNLPIDFIKIDASLISDIDRNLNSQIMVETIVSLAKKLNVATIAEFVSSEEILNTVKRLGVDYAQGFYLGRPEPIEYHLSKSDA